MANSTGRNTCRNCPRTATHRVKQSRDGWTRIYWVCDVHAIQRGGN